MELLAELRSTNFIEGLFHWLRLCCAEQSVDKFFSLSARSTIRLTVPGERSMAALDSHQSRVLPRRMRLVLGIGVKLAIFWALLCLIILIVLDANPLGGSQFETMLMQFGSELVQRLHRDVADDTAVMTPQQPAVALFVSHLENRGVLLRRI